MPLVKCGPKSWLGPKIFSLQNDVKCRLDGFLAKLKFCSEPPLRATLYLAHNKRFKTHFQSSFDPFVFHLRVISTPGKLCKALQIRDVTILLLLEMTFCKTH